MKRGMRGEEGKDVPHCVHLSPAAKEEWRAMFNAHHAEQNEPGFPHRSLAGPWAKLQQYAGRFVLILHLLDQAADPTSDLVNIPDVPRRIVKDAARLLGYFKSHARRVNAAMRPRALSDAGDDDVQTVLKWTLGRGLDSFSLRDLRRDLSRTFGKRAQDLEKALAWLVEHKCIRLQAAPKQAGHRRGRRPSPKYLVNPYLLASQNRHLAPEVDDQAVNSGDNGSFAALTAADAREEVADDLPVF